MNNLANEILRLVSRNVDSTDLRREKFNDIVKLIENDEKIRCQATFQFLDLCKSDDASLRNKAVSNFYIFLGKLRIVASDEVSKQLIEILNYHFSEERLAWIASRDHVKDASENDKLSADFDFFFIKFVLKILIAIKSKDSLDILNRLHHTFRNSHFVKEIIELQSLVSRGQSSDNH